jgi:mono/diheme cytochrome c family protein
MRTTIAILAAALLMLAAAVILAGGGQGAADSTKSVAADAAQAVPDTAGRDMGTGPVKQVEMGPLDPKMAAEGKNLFDNKCAVCHAMKERKVGPPLGHVAGQRTPEFIMNMIMNAPHMEQNDPVAKKLLAEYMVSMPNLSLDRTQAREILEYLRQENESGAKDPAQKTAKEPATGLDKEQAKKPTSR